MNNKKNINEEEARKYYENGHSLSEIGKIFGCDRVTVSNRLKAAGVPRRTYSESLKGRTIHWKNKIGRPGTKLSEECKRKISEKKMGNVPFSKGKSKVTHPEDVTWGVKGEKHWNWKGGISLESNRIRQSSEYKFWRKSVFERDKWTCVLCNKKASYVEADHIKPFSTHPELRFDVENGRCLCKSCHKIVTSEQRKKLKNEKERNQAP